VTAETHHCQSLPVCGRSQHERHARIDRDICSRSNRPPHVVHNMVGVMRVQGTRSRCMPCQFRECRSDLQFDWPMDLQRERLSRIKASLFRVASDWTANVFRWFPFISRPDVSVDVSVGIAENLVVRPTWPVDALDGFSEETHIDQELCALCQREITEVSDLRDSEQDAVSRQKLSVPHDSVAALHAGNHRRILGALCCSNAIPFPVRWQSDVSLSPVWGVMGT
jgi:hypothetical protein